MVNRMPLGLLLRLLYIIGSMQLIVSSSNAPCLAGFYAQSPNDLTCLQCPINYYCPGGLLAKVICPSGTYSEIPQNTAFSACLPCTGGFSCVNGNRTSCLAGSFSSGNASSCTPCPTGYYVAVAGQSSCAICPVGSMCASASVAPVACGAGTYSASGKTSCTPCPAGSTCISGSPVECAAGFFSGLQSSCTACSSGQYSLSGSSVCVSCPAGSKCPSSSVLPVRCSAGQVSGGGSTSCTICASGQYTTANTTSSCIDCPIGYSCPSTSFSPVSCADGTYTSSTKGVSCSVCPIGKACKSGSIVSCVAPYYALAGATNCTISPAGFRFSSVSTAPVLCTSGQYSSAGATLCTTCALGFSCPTTTGLPIPCPARTYQPSGGQTTCLLCPVSNACTATATTVCSNGTYINGTQCSVCPAGYACPSPIISSAPVTKCPLGTFRLPLGSTCQNCPAGSFCPVTTDSVIACSSGTYSAANAVACTNCPPGFSCSSTIGAPSLCAAGTYSIGSQTSCFSCPAGSICPSTTTNVQLTCPPGTYSLNNSIACIDCPAGSYCSKNNIMPIVCSDGQYSLSRASACTPCPAGFKCESKSEFPTYACVPGTFAKVGNGSCTSCLPGGRCPLVTTDLFEPCQTTPLVTYSVGGQAVCTMCEAGRYYSAVSNTMAPDLLCSAGTYSLLGCPSGNACVDCPAGSYCPVTNNTPIICPPGTYSAKKKTVCSICAAGSWCSTVSSSICGNGLWSSEGQTACTRCDDGYLCGSQGQIAPVISKNPVAGLCPAGYWCADGDTKNACPAGTYQNKTGQYEANSCILCPFGSYCEFPSTVTPSQCVKGYYCPSGTASYLSFPCPKGTYNDQLGSKSSAACLDCLAGVYCNEAQTTTGSSCPKGYYCPAKTLNSKHHPCPPGTYGDAQGFSSAQNCTNCPIGMYCADVAVGNHPSGPVNCPAGTYNPNTNSSSVLNCLPCPAGNSCPLTGMSTYFPSCAPGYYCPLGTLLSNQYACPPGTFSNSTALTTSSQCTICPAGKACNWGTNEGSNVALDCMAGYYCPSGTASTTSYPCPSGTWSNRYNLTMPSECTICSAGYYCTGGQSTMISTCLPGYFCPRGTARFNQFSCRAGYYYPTSRNEVEESCLPCSQGSYCEISSNLPVACPLGTYNDKGSRASASEGTAATRISLCVVQCRSAYPGLFEEQYLAVSNLTACITGCSYGNLSQVCPVDAFVASCNKGFDYWTAAVGLVIDGSGVSFTNDERKDCISCPAGYYCDVATGTVTPLKCPIGRYSTSGQSVCTLCAAGSFCPVLNLTEVSMYTTYLCEAGTFCSSGLSSQAAAAICSIGRYCPKGTTEPLPCPPGTFNNETGRGYVTNCTACPAGYYCVEGASSPTGVCTKGYFCPTGITTNEYSQQSLGAHIIGLVIGSYGPLQEPCPAGTYLNTAGGTKLSDCQLCPITKYCPPHTSEPILCPRGYWCSGNTSSPIPCVLGTYGNVTGMKHPDQCSPCEEGLYCDKEAAWVPTGPCSEGYQCFARATQSTPTDGLTGRSCAPGGYCPPGTGIIPVACGLGTFNNISGSSTIQDCQACTQGYFCASTSNPGPSGLCAVGYFCNGSAISAQQYAAPKGYYAAIGSAAAVKCQPGYYQPAETQGSCLTCDEGYYCPDAAMSTKIICPAGFFCPLGSTSYIGSFAENVCPIGTYGPYEGQKNISACINCPPGKFCAGGTALAGAITPSGNCSDGYICFGAAQFGQPSGTNITWGTICPAGFYCPSGTVAAIPCPVGTFSQTSGLYQLEKCQKCTAGRYCPSTNMTSAGPPCNAGYYCSVSSITPTPIANTTLLATLQQLNNRSFNAIVNASLFDTYLLSDLTGDICPVGYYCPQGSSIPIVCAPGTYSANSGSSMCTDCQAGEYCSSNGAQAQVTCPVGKYCPIRSVSPIPCPLGTYQPYSQQTSLAACTACDAGHYCSSTGSSSVTGICFAGHYCTNASRSERPSTVPNSHFEVSGSCPAGSYCPEGSEVPIKCSPGSYSAAEYAVNSSTCQLCPLNKYCATAGLTAPTGPCAATYYCLSGASVATPNGTTGNLCPAGHTCDGSSAPIQCPAGRYSNAIGQTACIICPAGYYCPVGTQDYASFPCPSGYYCERGSASFSMQCPIGTYLPSTMGMNISACLPCDAGKYCGAPGLAAVTGPCDVGWYCTQGATSIQPLSTAGGRCQAGYFCPAGSTSPIPCTAGFYCEINELALPTGACRAGYYCPGGSLSDTGRLQKNDDDKSCLPGRYCPANSSIASLCPVGTFSSTINAVSSSVCLSCTAGFFCSDAGSTRVSGNCSAGFYCPPGQSSPNPMLYICPVGHYCPIGSSTFSPCSSGSYSAVNGSHSCSACTAGYACVSNGQIICPKGHYCPSGTIDPYQYPCPSGTFNNLTGSISNAQCNSCSAGMYCANSGLALPEGLCSAGFFCLHGAYSKEPNQGINGTICPAGAYCLNGTSSSLGTPCPAGTYNAFMKQVSLDSCLPCPPGKYCQGSGLTIFTGVCDAGHYCTASATTSNPINQSYGDECPAGSYCPVGSPSHILCSIGTFSASLRRSTVCNSCTMGMYCDIDGLMAPVGNCNAGYYCTSGSTTHSPPSVVASGGPCPTGHFCPSGTVTPLVCAAGTYMSSSGATVCLQCPTGSRCIFPFQTPTACPTGFYCPTGTGLNPLACPLGTYSNTINLQNESQCTVCDAGKYCQGTGLTAVNGSCSLGFYCVARATTATPTDLVLHGGAPCSRGHYCPTGSYSPQPCAAGTYANLTGLSLCTSCLPGYYCPFGTIDPVMSDFICPKGHYCLQGTAAIGVTTSCPAGKYNNQSGAASSVSCLSCPPGLYCGNIGLALPSGPCLGGYFCSSGAAVSNPASGLCGLGTYCPNGSFAPLSCTGGFYCDASGLSAPTGPCAAGFYCSSRASSPNPVDGVSGKSCNAGYYCPNGTTIPIPCPLGTYTPSTSDRSGTITSCALCPAGKYCSILAMTTSTAAPSCSAGYYCPSGQSTGTPAAYVCPVGYFCTSGLGSPQKCSNGYYQNSNASTSCLTCPQSYYCNNNDAPVISPDLFPCPAGFYCPAGTAQAEQFRCPIGTFSNDLRLHSSAQCSPCSAGHYCGSSGLTAPTGLCQAGYFCVSGATSPTPNQGAAAGACPAGSFCPTGAISPLQCPPGTFSSVLRLHNSSQCLPCLSGKFCETFGLSIVTGSCMAGFLCGSGANVSNPANSLCPAGSFCLVGAVTPSRCPLGTYSATLGLTKSSDCLQCTAGKYCDVTGLTAPAGNCTAGYYCIGGSNTRAPLTVGINGGPCSVGYFCPSGSVQMVPCTAGTYTRDTKSDSCLTCPPGFTCPSSGMSVPAPCPLGRFCPNGTGLLTQPCPAGSYGASTRLSSAVDCVVCDAGKYCGSSGLLAPSGLCDEGFYCGPGSSSPAPINVSSCPLYGDLCPIGHYCVNGSSVPKPCPSGQYNTVRGASTCLSCLVGFFCPLGSTNAGTQCPSGHYCEVGSSIPALCPPGTFNNVTGGASIAACLPCSEASFCAGSGLSQPTGLCLAGSYCPARSISAYGLPCPVGHFCPPGSSTPTRCLPGYYCDVTNLVQPTGLCFPGYYCTGSAQKGDETPCDRGYYCGLGTSIPDPCPPGSYSSSQSLRNSSQCLACDVGSYCVGGAINTSGLCAAGFVCSSPGERSDSAHPCPAGFYCPPGTVFPKNCEFGSYQDQTGQFICKECPPGKYCEAGPLSNLALYSCPLGSYCPAGTANRMDFQCPPGFFGNVTGGVDITACVPCLAGYYCGSSGLIAPSNLCDAGHYCITNANTSSPLDGVTGNICPKGAYCTAGSTTYTACPPGSYVDSLHSTSLSDCLKCEVGFYCPVGIEKFPCAAGYVCLLGNAIKNPNHTYVDLEGFKIGGYPCPSGSYCVEGSISEVPCDAGFYNNDTGAGICRICPAGSLCPFPSMFTPIICPVGGYCPAGSAFRLPCPVGSYSNVPGLKSELDCLLCPRGSYCLSSGLSEPSGNCSGGFLCLIGQSQPTPITNLLYDQNYFTEVLSCFSDEESYQTMFERLVNYDFLEVLIDNKISNITSGPCPLGHYCPNGTLGPLPCPVGTINPIHLQKSVESCTLCSAGKYCATAGLSTATGKCNAGFYCPGGQVTATPDSNKCLVGHYCPTGSSSSVPCPSGTYAGIEGMALCDRCLAGHRCIAGTNSTSTPEVCPIGNVCAVGSGSTPVHCVAGTYSNKSGLILQSECLPCSAGHWCRNGVIVGLCDEGFICISGSATPTPTENVSSAIGKMCQKGFFCPSGVLAPVSCPNGTIAYSTFETVRDVTISCPPGFNYSAPALTSGAGSIAACRACPPGFQCIESVLFDCPLGFYCPQGMTNPVPCESGLLGTKTRATSSADCAPCPKGFYCIYNSSTLSSKLECTAGHFCPTGTILPLLCPISTFRATQGAGDIDDCSNCTAGYYCPDMGMITPIPCPPAYYCPVKSFIPLPCNPGYFCPSLTANALPCTGGYYCENATVTPIPCPPGHFCDSGDLSMGAFAPTVCPLGTYDPYFNITNVGAARYRMSATVVNDVVYPAACQKCPAGKYGNNPQRSLCYDCEPGFVCLEGAAIGNNATRNQTVNGIVFPADMCSPYDGLGINNSVVGYPNTLSYPCPPGSYCPAQSGYPIPCPPGTFNANLMATSIDDCTPCAAGEFASNAGQIGCFSCGSSSDSVIGSRTCECIGANRDFNSIGKQCICKAQYTARRGTEFDYTPSDGITPCQQRIYDKCSEQSTRNSDGDCLTNAMWDEFCLKECASGVAVPSHDATLGLCLCITQSVDVICDSVCLEEQRSLQYVHCVTPPELVITDPVTLNTTVSVTSESNDANDYGAIACGYLFDGRKIQTFVMETTDRGIVGLFRLPNTSSTSHVARRSTSRRFAKVDANINHQGHNNSSQYPFVSPLFQRLRRSHAPEVKDSLFSSPNLTLGEVDNPLVCLQLGQVVAFAVTNDHFPMYDHDNFLNDVEDPYLPFDQSTFLELHSKFIQLKMNIGMFYYPFLSPGLAVLQDYDGGSGLGKKSYFRTMAKGIACPPGGPFYPSTASNYYINGVSMNSKILVTPDWALLGYISGGGIALILIMIGLLVLFKNKGWTKHLYTSPAYRAAAQAADFDLYSSKGSQLDAAQRLHPNSNSLDSESFDGIADTFWDYERQVDLEAFDVEKFFSKLDDHTNIIQSELKLHKDEIEAMYKKSATQSSALKILWSNKMNLKSRARLALADAGDLAGQEAKLVSIEAEMGRRVHMATLFKVLLSEKLLATKTSRENNQSHTMFTDSLVAEFILNCKWIVEHGNQGHTGKLFKAKLSHVNFIVKALDEEHVLECKRRGSLCALREASFMGGVLVTPGTLDPMPMHKLIMRDGPLRDQLFESDVIARDENTGLFLLNKGQRMILSDKKTIVDVPNGFFVHPQTARLLPIEGSVAYHALTRRFVTTVDATQFWALQDLIPFIPFPETAQSNLLTPLPFGATFVMGATFLEPTIGYPVSLLACTIDSTGTVLPLGGIYSDPFTGLLTAIEIGLPMLDGSGRLCPIVGVTISPSSGKVIPVGGYINSDLIDIGQLHLNLVYSTLPLCVSGASFDQAMNIMPIVGGIQSVLDNAILCKELEQIEELLNFLREHGTGDKPDRMRNDFNAMSVKLDVINRDLGRIHTQRSILDTERHGALIMVSARISEIVKFNGALGQLADPSTGRTIYLLPGQELIDVASSIAVSVLGVAFDTQDDVCIPLAGLMDDIKGDSRCPISIGIKYTDPITEKVRFVAGAAFNSATNDVFPTNVPCWNRRPFPLLLPSILASLDEELIARKSSRRRQSNYDEDAMKLIFGLGCILLSDEEELDTKLVDKQLASMTALVESKLVTSEREKKRKAEFARSGIPAEAFDVLNVFDKQEASLELVLQDNYTRMVEVIRKYLSCIQEISKSSEAQLKIAAEDQQAVLRESFYKQLKEKGDDFTQVFNIIVREVVQHRSYLNMFEGMAGPTGNKARSILQLLISASSLSSSAPGKSKIAFALEELVETAKAHPGASLKETENIKPVLPKVLLLSSSPQKSVIQTSTLVSSTEVAKGVSGSTSAVLFKNRKSVNRKNTSNSLLEASSGFSRGLSEPTMEVKAQALASVMVKEQQYITAVIAQAETKRVEDLAALSDAFVSKLSDKSLNMAAHDKMMVQYEADVAEVNHNTELILKKSIDEAIEKLAGEHVKSIGGFDRNGESISVDQIKENLRLLAEQLAIMHQQLLSGPEFDEKPKKDHKEMESLISSLNGSRRGSSSISPDNVTATQLDGELDEAKDTEKALDSRAHAMKDKIAARKALRVRAVDNNSALTLEDKEAKKAVIEANTAAQLLAFNTSIDQVKAKNNSRLNERFMKIADSSQNAAVAEMIRKTTNQVSSQISIDRSKAKDALADKLAARKRMKEAQLLIQTTADKSIDTQQVDGTPMLTAPIDTVKQEEAKQRLQVLEDAYIRRQTEIEENKRTTIKAMQDQLLKEIAALELVESNHLNLMLEKEAATKAKELDAKFYDDIESKKHSMSEEAYKLLVSQFEKAKKIVENSMLKEKNTANASLQARLLERKQRKGDRIITQAEIAASQEALVNDRELAVQMNADKLIIEQDILRAIVADASDGTVEKTVLDSLKRRHAAESFHMKTTFATEKALALDAALNALDNQRHMEKDQLLQQQSMEAAKLATSNVDVPEKERESRKTILRSQHKRALVAFDVKSDSLKERSEKDSANAIARSHNQQLLDLQNKQYSECSATLNELSPLSALSADYLAKSAKAKSDADENRRLLHEAGDKRIQKVKQAKLDLEKANEEEKAKRVAAAVAELAADEEKKKAFEAKLALNLIHKEQKERDQAKSQLAAQLSGIETEAERKEIIEKHNISVANQEKIRNTESLRAKTDMEKKLALRREKRSKERSVEEAAFILAQATAIEALGPETEIDEDKPSSPPVQERAVEEVEVEEVLVPAAPMNAETGLSEQIITDILLRSPLGEVLRRINDIESMVKSGNFTSKVRGGSFGTVSVDEMELAWDKSTAVSVIPVDLDRLSATSFVLYRFGVFITRMLATGCGLPRVALLIASDLPPSPSRQNAFRNSYSYEANTRVLFVREGRLKTIGDLALVVTHGLAHIKCGDMDNDQNPAFISAFYEALRCIYLDLFMARTRARENTTKPLVTLFAETAFEHRVSFINELVDLHVESASTVSENQIMYDGMVAAADLQRTMSASVNKVDKDNECYDDCALDKDMLDLVSLLRTESILKAQVGRSDAASGATVALEGVSIKREKVTARISKMSK